MKTNEEYYPSWKTMERILISDIEQAAKIDYKYFIANNDVG